MSESAALSVIGAGGGGGKSGSSGGVSEAADTLSSNAYVQFIDVLGEGEIKGLVNGEASIYLNGVPLRDISGTPNYQGFTWAANVGTPTQLPLPSFRSLEDEVQVGVALLASAGGVVRSVADAGADAIRVTVSVQGLTKATKEGALNGTSVNYRIDVRVAGGSWIQGAVLTLSGKTRTRFQRQHQVDLAPLGQGPYEVRVTRLTPDSTTALVTDALYWDSFTVVNREVLSYPNTALVGLRIDAKYFSQIPARTYHVRGLIIRVPANYDPVARTYATTGPGTTNGAWDGTFKLAYSNNPAWCFYDLCTNARYGLGTRIKPAQMDKWALYEIGRYCDELVPRITSGSGVSGYSSSGGVLANVPLTNDSSDLEPRFTLNCVINVREDAFKVLNQLTNAFRGMAYWASGAITVTQDRPTDPSAIFTNANVENGVFTYEGSARSQRNTVVLVSWNDPSEDFKQKYEYVEDREGIQRYGIRTTDIVAFGCTSRSQARRLGLWMLYTQRLESSMVHFKAGLDAAQVSPGAVVQIMDSHRAGARWGGRLVSATLSAVTVDSPLTLTAGSYTLSVMMPDGEIASRSVVITSAGSYSTLNLATPLSVLPVDAAIWTMASAAVTPMLARVVSVKQEGTTACTISAVEHNPSKYDAIERDAKLAAQNYSFLSYDSAPRVLNLAAVESTTRTAPDAPAICQLDVSWQPNASPSIRGYVVSYTSPMGDTGVMPETRFSTVTLTPLQVGTYTVTVYAVNSLGLPGPSETATGTVTGTPVVPNDPSAAPQLQNLGAVASFSDVEISWDWPTYSAGGGNGSTEIFYAERDPTGPAPTLAAATQLAVVPSSSRTYTDRLQPNRVRHYWARHITRYGTPCPTFTGGTNGVVATTASFAVLTVTTTSNTFTQDSNGVTPSAITITAKGQLLRGQPTFELVSGTVTMTGTGLSRTLVGSSMETNSAAVRVTWDGQQELVTITRVVIGSEAVESPTVPESPEAAGALRTIFVRWNYVPYSGHKSFQVYRAVDSTNFSDAQIVETTISDSFADSNVVAGKTYTYWVRSVNRLNQPSAFTSPVSAAVATLGGVDLAPLSVDAAKLAVGAVDLGSTKVTGTITDPARFGAAAIGYTVTQYLVATSGVLGNLVVDSAQISGLDVSKLRAGSLLVGQYIRSATYVAGSSGWAINADGTAEFSAASIRGQLSAAQIDTTGLIVRDGSGNPILGAGYALPVSYMNAATPIPDTRSTNLGPSSYGVGRVAEFKSTSAIGLSTSAGYCTLETLRSWNDSSGGEAVQWAYVSSGEVWKRSAPAGATTWGAWVRDLDRSTYTGDLNATYGATIGANLGGSFTQATWDVVMSSAYIRLAHINTATIVNLSALSSVLGTVDIVTGGWLRSGQSAWSTGSGFWLGWIGSGPGEPGFSIGDSSAYLRYRPSTGLEIKLSTYTLSLSSGSGMAVYLYLGGNGTYTLGTYTATPAGGVAPYSYAWSVSTYSNGVNPAQFTAIIQPSGNTCVMRVNSTASSSASVAQWVSLTCTVTDANGRATSTTYSPIISWNGYDTSGL